MSKKFTTKKNFGLTSKNLLGFSHTFSKGSVFQHLNTDVQSHSFFKVVVNITNNNIFCTLVDIKSSKIILQFSAGKCEVSFSKKQVRYGSKIVLERFFKECQNLLTNSVVVLKFSGPVRMRRFVLNLAFYQLRLLDVSKLFFDIKANKCFNGCRPPKKRRKKNKGVRLLK